MIVIRSVEPYIARGVTWAHQYEIEVDGEIVNDDATTEEVVEFLREEAQ